MITDLSVKGNYIFLLSCKNNTGLTAMPWQYKMNYEVSGGTGESNILTFTIFIVTILCVCVCVYMHKKNV